VRSLLHRLLAGVRELRYRREDAELEVELEDYLRRAMEQKVAAGMSPEEAERSARLEMGGVEQIKEHVREIRWESRIDYLSQDIRYAVRSLAASKIFTAVSILTLALGIGANTAIFAILNGVILQPLAYPKPDQLMYFSTRVPALNLASFWVSPVEYFEFRELNQSFSNAGAFHVGEVSLFDGVNPHRVRSAAVDEHLLATLGVRAAQGRLFTTGETISTLPAIAPGQPPPGTAAVAILSHELWQSAFGGQPLVGRRVDVEGVSREVIGILPPGVDLMDHQPEVWLPIGINPADRRNRAGHFLSVVGRLKDGVTVESARAELDALIDTWADRVGVSGEGVAGHTFIPADRTEYRGKKMPNPGHVLQFTPLQDEVIGLADRSIWMLQASVGLVLLIACANLASLFLARADTRRRELAVRTALGATPGRLLQQFITEGLLLATAGAALGIIVARAGLVAFVRTYPHSLPRTSSLDLDGVVLLFAGGVAVVSALLFASAPLVHTRIKGLAAVIREGTDRHAGGPRQWVRASLVIAEVALAVVLVTGAALLARSVLNLTTVDVGFDRSRLITFSTTLPQARYPQLTTRVEAYQSILERIRGIPGVLSAAAMSGLPPERLAATMATDFDGYAATAPGDPPEFADYTQYVLGNYFETMAIPILQGRAFNASDAASSGRVVVVNKTLAGTFWKGRDPIGQRLRPCCSAETPWSTVVGVAADVKQGGIDKDTGPEIYFPLDQLARPGSSSRLVDTMHVMARTMSTFDETAPFIRAVVREIDPTVPIVRLREMDDVLLESIQRPRLLSSTISIFAGLALLIAVVGTYGLLSYTVTERRHEIGIRIALGASRGRILAHILGSGLALVLIGTIVGTAAAIALSRFIKSLLFGIAATDVSTFLFVLAAVVGAGTLASSIPAWQASRLDPLPLIRED
jgi:putative ABC transport system permease protein